MNMKRITMMIALMLVCVAGAVAQPKSLSVEDKEKLFNAKAQMMQEKLQLSEGQMKDFLSVYRDYNEAISKIIPPKPERPNAGEELTSDQAYAKVMQQLKFKKDILEVQEEYIGKLKSVLTPRQLMRFLKVEQTVQMNILDHKRARGAHYGKPEHKGDAPKMSKNHHHHGGHRPMPPCKGDSACCPSRPAPKV